MVIYDKDVAEEAEVEKQSDVKKYLFSATGLFFIAVTILYFLGKGRFGITSIDTAHYWAFIAIFLYFFIKDLEAWLRLRTPKVTWSGGSSTTAMGDIIEVDNWSIIRLEGISLGPYQPNKGIFICPSTAVNKMGRNIVCAVRGIQVELNQLPPGIVEYVIANKLNPPYIFGLVAEEQYSKEVDDVADIAGVKKAQVSYLVTEIKALIRQVNFFKNIAGEKIGGVEQYTEIAKRIAGPPTKPLTTKVKEKLEEKEE